MSITNLCEHCGHYSWVHKDGACLLNYCSCGKDTKNGNTPQKSRVVGETTTKSEDADPATAATPEERRGNY